VNGQELVTMVCSPQDLEELGVGFLLSEGIITQPDDILSIDLQEEGLLHIRLKNEILPTLSFLQRHIASCCGKGRAGLYFINDAKQVKVVESTMKVKPSRCIEHMDRLEESSHTFHLTGGVHSAALTQGDLFLFSYEDIGRHNAVDKVLGAGIRQELCFDDKCLYLSGRISSEIVIKAARAGIPVIVSKAAPTDLAVDLAEDLNISIVGFVRDQKLNIYSCPERLIME
jgi:FdhD protein